MSLLSLMLLLSGAQQIGGIWTALGTVISGSPSTDESNVQEPNVIYESGTFKMWLKGGWDTSHLNYYTSSDGITWTPYDSNPLILSGSSGVEQPFIFKDGSTYYLYCKNAGLGNPFRRYSSSDGATWSLDNATTLTVGAGGQWDDYNLGNIFVWKEGTNDWRAIYEALDGGSGVWKLGYATSSDGLTWSKSGSNPVITETGSLGGPFLYKSTSGLYWMWIHHSPSGFLPTDLERYYSADLVHWTKNPSSDTLWRVGYGEGEGSPNGQIADPTLLELNGDVYLWLTTNHDGSGSSGHATIGLKIAYGQTFETLIHTKEGY